jgi:hypothetical protein
MPTLDWLTRAADQYPAMNAAEAPMRSGFRRYLRMLEGAVGNEQFDGAVPCHMCLTRSQAA